MQKKLFYFIILFLTACSHNVTKVDTVNSNNVNLTSSSGSNVELYQSVIDKAEERRNALANEKAAGETRSRKHEEELKLIKHKTQLAVKENERLMKENDRLEKEAIRKTEDLTLQYKRIANTHKQRTEIYKRRNANNK